MTKLSTGARETEPAPLSPPMRKRHKTSGMDRAPVAHYTTVREDQHEGIVLIFKPQRLEVFGDRVLPALVMLPLQTGLNGVRKKRNGEWDLSGLRENEESNGAFVCPLDWDYDFPGDGPPNKDGVVPSTHAWKTAEEFHATVASWVDDGRLPKPRIEHLEQLVERKSRDVTFLADAKNVPEVANRHRNEIVRQLEVAERALAAARTEEAS